MMKKQNRLHDEYTDTHIEKALVDQLYRYDCISPTMLQEYAWGMLSSEGTYEVEQHTQHCALCLHTVVQHQRIIEQIAEPEPQYISSIVDDIKDGVTKTRLFVAELVEDMQDAIDVMFPAPTPAYAGLRGTIQHKLSYEAGDVIIDLQVRPGQEPSMMVLGQILGLPDHIIHTSGAQETNQIGKFRLMSQNESRSPIVGTVSRHGRFEAERVDSGKYQLTLELADATYTILGLAINVEA